MGKTPRERVLITLLPAILAVCGYLVLYDRSKDLKAANEALAAARSAQVSQQTVFEERMKLADLQEESTRLKAEKGELETRRKALASVRDAAPAVRAEALRQLSNMLWKKGLHPYQESPVDSNDTQQTSQTFDEVLRTLAAPSPTAVTTPGAFNAAPVGDPTAAKQRLWQIRFYGRYGDVAAALETLRDSGLPIIPVSITMSETRVETNWRSWTLMLWL
jgi:hypothetical protein